MSRLPRRTGAQMIAALHKLGFLCVRIRGSHHVMRHPDGRQTVVPVHTGETLGPGLIRRILADARISPEDFAAL